MCFANNNNSIFPRMSRIKSSRNHQEICGDCGASDPSWASINRGILLCADCCSVHRSLGRHISQVKSLRQGTWPPSVLNFVNSLNAHGANSVWEHTILDPNAPKNLKRKPHSKDPLHPTKSDFIRSKHVNLAFVLKPSVQEDGLADLEEELSKQLHASVRAANLEVSLRLLVQGADPNYYHEEKGSTPLHMAAKAGQASQIELMIVYGADLTVRDAKGNTAVEIATNNKHHGIADRLVEAMYEVTDRLSYFLGGKRPDHTSGKHLIVPEHGNAGEISEQLKIARGKLQLVPNKMFEELVMDLYDEVDRREMEAIWATSALNPDIGAVPFLPTNPHLSATRNQGRQKLARFSPSEFAGLLTDVLIDARRRQNMATLRPIDSIFLSDMRASNLSDDEPLYDAVASDDDYAALAPVAQQALVNQSPVHTASNVEIETLRKKLQESFSEITELKTLVQKLATENTDLKTRIDCPVTHDFDVPLRIDLQTTNGGSESETEPVHDGKQYGKRPVSMYEAREGLFNKLSILPESRTTTSMYQMAGGNRGKDAGLPLAEEVKHRTDVVTRRLTELWNAMQDPSLGKDAFVPCAERIRVAIAELIAIFPQTVTDETIKNALKELNMNTNSVQTECTGLQCALLSDNAASTDLFLQEVRNCTYNLAMANKTLVTKFI